MEYRKSLLAVRHASTAVGLGKKVLLTTPVVRLEYYYSYELKAPTRELDDSSNIEVAMGLGEIQLVGTADEKSRDDEQVVVPQENKTPVGYERILRDLLGNKDERQMLHEHVAEIC